MYFGIGSVVTDRYGEKGEKIEERKKLLERQRIKTNNIINKYDMIVFILIYQVNQTYFSIKYVEGSCLNTQVVTLITDSFFF